MQYMKKQMIYRFKAQHAVAKIAIFGAPPERG